MDKANQLILTQVIQDALHFHQRHLAIAVKSMEIENPVKHHKAIHLMRGQLSDIRRAKKMMSNLCNPVEHGGA